LVHFDPTSCCNSLILNLRCIWVTHRTHLSLYLHFYTTKVPEPYQKCTTAFAHKLKNHNPFTMTSYKSESCTEARPQYVVFKSITNARYQNANIHSLNRIFSLYSQLGGTMTHFILTTTPPLRTYISQQPFEQQFNTQRSTEIHYTIGHTGLRLAPVPIAIVTTGH
jgi:hypothetical protein